MAAALEVVARVVLQWRRRKCGCADASPIVFVCFHCRCGHCSAVTHVVAAVAAATMITMMTDDDNDDDDGHHGVTALPACVETSEAKLAAARPPACKTGESLRPGFGD